MSGSNNDELVEVSFNLQASEGPQSRTISDGQKAQELFYGAFDQDGNVIPTQHGKKTMDKPTEGTTVTFKLVKGQTYDFVFWAQTPGNKYYNVNPENLTEISVNYNTDANDENRDAFFGNELDYKVEGKFTKTVYLTRPFGQLNLGTTIQDYNDATALLSEKAVNKSKLVVKNLPSKLNLLTSEVSGSTADATFTLAALPKDSDTEGDYEILYVDTDKNEDTADEQYVHLSMNYLLAAEASVLHEVDITLTNGDEEKNIINIINVPNVPIQRNYRTNILGQILTTEGEFKIIVDEEFLKPDIIYNLSEYTVASQADFVAVLNALNDAAYTGPENVIINLATDMTWETGAGHGSTPLLTETSKIGSLTIDGKGQYSLTATGSGVGSLRAANGETLVFKDLTIDDESVSYAESSWEFTYLEFAGNLEFDNCTFTSGIQIDSDNGSAPECSVVFNNCKFNSPNASEYSVWLGHGTAIFNECEFTGTRGLKIHEAYGSEVKEVLVDACEFGPLSEKPGIAIGTLNAETAVTVRYSVFMNCQAGDQQLYIYETDTDVSSFNFVEERNTVINQQNAEVIEIANVTELMEFASAVNDGNSYLNKVVVLTSDIDLANIDWTPIGTTTTFEGVFDGRNHTIRNLTVKVTENEVSAGLFGRARTVKNVNLSNVNISGLFKAGAIVGDGYHCAKIENCHVDGGTIISIPDGNKDYGNHVGGIVGYLAADGGDAYVKDCSAKNLTLKGYRDVGGILGTATGNSTLLVENNTAKNVEVIADMVAAYCESGKKPNAGEIVGRKENNLDLTTNTAVNVSVKVYTVTTDEEGNSIANVGSADGLVYALENGYNVTLSEDVTAPLANSAIYGTPVAVIMEKGGIFDGNNKSLDIENPQYNGYAIETYGGTIKNLTIDSPVGRGIVISSPTADVYIENVVIDGPGYAVNTTEHNGKNLYITKSTINGWTSLAGLDAVSFTECKFGENTSKYWQNMGYGQDYDRLVRPYVSTTFDSCVFEKDFYIDLSALGTDCKVTLKQCKVGDVILTSENYTGNITIELPAGRTLVDCVVFE